jgi:hypothetical protein
MKAFDFSKIDWSELRNQKRSLLNVITELETFTGFSLDAPVKAEKAEHLNGILHLIDSLQDHAVDNMGMSPSDVYDFEMEDPDFNPNF